MAKFKRAVERILIADGNAAVVANGSTTLVSSTGAANLSDGQLGIFDAGGFGTNTNGTAISTGDTPVESPAIVIAQGTPDSASPGPAAYAGQYKRIYESSHRIFGRGTKVWRGKAYVAPRLNAWVLGADDSAADAIGTPESLTEYGVMITTRSRRTDEEVSTAQRKGTRVTFVTPDYDADATITNPLDHLVQNLVFNINRHSRYVTDSASNRGKLPFVALAVRFEGSFSGANSTTNVSDLDSLDGATVVTGYGFSTDAETVSTANNSAMGAAFVAMVADTNADVDTDTQVVDIDLDTAGTAVSGCNGILIIALDDEVAFDDRIPQVKVKLDVSKLSGFGSAVGLYDSSDVQEAGWTPRQIRIFYADTVGQRAYSQNRSMIPIVEIPDIDNYIDDTDIYDSYCIESHDLSNQLVSPDVTDTQITWIFVPSGDTTTKNSLEAALNAYFAPVMLPAVNI